MARRWEFYYLKPRPDMLKADLLKFPYGFPVVFWPIMKSSDDGGLFCAALAMENKLDLEKFCLSGQWAQAGCFQNHGLECAHLARAQIRSKTFLATPAKTTTMPFLQGKLQRYSSAPLGGWGHIGRSSGHAHVLGRLVPWQQAEIYPGLDRIIGASPALWASPGRRLGAYGASWYRSRPRTGATSSYMNLLPSKNPACQEMRTRIFFWPTCKGIDVRKTLRKYCAQNNCMPQNIAWRGAAHFGDFIAKIIHLPCHNHSVAQGNFRAVAWLLRHQDNIWRQGPCFPASQHKCCPVQPLRPRPLRRGFRFMFAVGNASSLTENEELP